MNYSLQSRVTRSVFWLLHITAADWLLGRAKVGAGSHFLCLFVAYVRNRDTREPTGTVSSGAAPWRKTRSL